MCLFPCWSKFLFVDLLFLSDSYVNMSLSLIWNLFEHLLFCFVPVPCPWPVLSCFASWLHTATILFFVFLPPILVSLQFLILSLAVSILCSHLDCCMSSLSLLSVLCVFVSLFILVCLLSVCGCLLFVVLKHYGRATQQKLLFLFFHILQGCLLTFPSFWLYCCAHVYKYFQFGLKWFYVMFL